VYLNYLVAGAYHNLLYKSLNMSVCTHWRFGVLGTINRPSRLLPKYQIHS